MLRDKIRVAILGASGFVGRNLLLHIPQHWYTYSFYRDPKFRKWILQNDVDTNSVIGDLNHDSTYKDVHKQFDLTICLVGNTDIKKANESPFYDYQSNVLPIIKFCQHVYSKKFIHFSSAAVYESYKGAVDVKNTIPNRCVSPYACHKVLAEKMVDFFSQRQRISNFYNIRLWGVYGPHEYERKLTTYLIRNFGIQKKDKIYIYGNGENFLSLMYISDCIRGIINISDSDAENATIDFGSFEPITVNELVRKTAEIFNVKPKISYHGESTQNTRFFLKPRDDNRFSKGQQTELKTGILKHFHWLKTQEYGRIFNK